MTEAPGPARRNGEPGGALPADQRTLAQAEMLANRLRKRFRHLKKWARRTGTDVFRLYDRDIPEIPLAFNWYGGALAGALYKRPYEKDEDDERRWTEAMAEAAADALGIGRDSVFIKVREHQRGAAQYRRMDDLGALRVVNEGGLRFQVNLSDYLDTGLFPDRRRLRALVRDKSAGKRVLNLFCYTASFSVYAAAGGAAEIDSVDLSNTYLAWSRKNFTLNGFTGVPVAAEALLESRRQGAFLPPFRFIRADVLSFLPAAAKARRQWDLIILDPPAFSNSKKMSGFLDIQRDHGGLVRGALRLLAPGGRLYFSANARGFRLDPAEFEKTGAPGPVIKDIQGLLTDEDFRGKKTPAAYLFRL
ncbi:MAG: class I SAM-dependent methyltransferase [Treponema sp.]|jgi:23S rRNA G2069 N7-methylase RlmK/C1962 C5-methylase RlmI|nr:class I SAM-dependent methyltransferase [Treponema sp.]